MIVGACDHDCRGAVPLGAPLLMSHHIGLLVPTVRDHHTRCRAQFIAGPFMTELVCRSLITLTGTAGVSRFFSRLSGAAGGARLLRNRFK
jgi:hypothetical protein